jgi:glycosyltransferase involved in cell wall biosynthesis
VSAFLFISASQRDLCAGLQLPPERVFVKHNFLPLSDPVPEQREPEHSQSGRVHLVAYLGRIDEGKGIPFLMQAWDIHRRRRPDSALRLVLGGSGPLSGEVAAWAEGRADVEVLGLLGRAECARLLRRARAVVLPSQWEETFGLVAVEAMAAGTPPLAADHGSFPELVTHGSDGLLFDHTSPAALATALAAVDRRPDVFEEYGERGCATYRARFSPTVNVAQLIGIYDFAVTHPVGADVRRTSGESAPHVSNQQSPAHSA